MNKARVLFVDDEPLILEMLQVTLEPMSTEWDLAFAESGEKALALMAKTPFDVVVSDMRMPGMTGAQLLNEVMERYAATVRFILSGYAENDQVMRCVGATHQFLAKPFELPALVAKLNQVRSLKDRLRSPEIRNLLVKRDFLPSMPAVYFRILEALQSPDWPVEQIARIVAQDPGLTTKILQLVNSAFFGFARNVSNADDAVMLLGLSTIRSLALTTRLFTAPKARPYEGYSVEQVWSHSMAVAQLAKKIALAEGGDERLVEESFTAGLLHDVGKMLLAENLGTRYFELMARADKSRRPLNLVEQEAWQTTHGEIGAYLLDLWGLPTPLVEAVALHHQPSKSPDSAFSALTAVHAADMLLKAAKAPEGQAPLEALDQAYLTRLGLGERVEAWRQQLQAEEA